MSDPAWLSRTSIVGRLRSAGCVFAEEEARLLVAAAGSAGELAELVGQRIAGRPLEHVLGWAEFCGLRIAVDPGVFVPRRRTEFLVGQAALITRPGSVVLDLCCGSGALGAALAAAVGGVELYCADIDPAAVRCARRNVAAAHGRVYQGDLYRALPASLRGRVDVMVVNAPYVPTHAIGLMPPEARLYEPSAALDGGVEGLDIQRRVIAAAPGWLAPAGHLLIETSDRQCEQTVALVARSGLRPQVAADEELDATVVIGANHRT